MSDRCPAGPVGERLIETMIAAAASGLRTSVLPYRAMSYPLAFDSARLRRAPQLEHPNGRGVTEIRPRRYLR